MEYSANALYQLFQVRNHICTYTRALRGYRHYNWAMARRNSPLQQQDMQEQLGEDARGKN